MATVLKQTDSASPPLISTSHGTQDTIASKNSHRLTPPSSDSASLVLVPSVSPASRIAHTWEKQVLGWWGFRRSSLV